MKAIASTVTMLALSIALTAQTPEAQTKTPPKPSPTYPAPAAQRVDPALEQLAKDYERAFNNGDVKSLVALYTDGAFRLGPNNQVMQGRAAIQEFYTAGFSGPTKPGTLAVRPGRTQMVTPDVAVLEGTYELAGTPATRGIYILTAVRQGGQWKIASVAPVPDM
jgi:uncharacterized protein (TIGR02246 family)